jgi:hypothetical protein
MSDTTRGKVGVGLGAAGALAALVTASLALPALAQTETEDANQLIAEAVQLRRDGRDDAALPLLMKAHASAGSARTASHLGLAEAALGYRVDAAPHLAEAIAGAPDDPWVRKNQAVLHTTLMQLAGDLGQLAIDGSPAGAEVWINDRRMGVLPLPRPLYLTPGKATVRVQVPGGRRTQQTVLITAGQQDALTVVLGETATRKGPAGRRRHTATGDDAGPGEDGADAAVAAGDVARDRGGSPRLSHAGQLGLLTRLDYRVLPSEQARFAVGFSYGINDHAELQAAALLGERDQGGWLGARFFLAQGRVKPALELAIPLLADPLHLGVHGGAGITLELGRHAALFADLGVTVYPDADDDLGQVWVLPAGGAQLRF